MSKIEKLYEIFRIISDSLLSVFMPKAEPGIEMSTRRERERRYKFEELCKILLDLLLMRKWDRLVFRMATAAIIVAVLSTNWTDEKMDPVIFILWLCAAIIGTTFLIFCLNLIQEIKAEKEERAFHAAKACDIGGATEYLNKPTYLRIVEPDWREKTMNAADV